MSGFVIHYNFDLTSTNGNQLYNSAISQYDATLVSSTVNYPTINNPGPNKNIPSIYLNQSQQQYISINPYTTSSNGLSFSLWFNLTNPSSSQNYSLFNFSNGSSGQYISAELSYNSSTSNISIILSLSGSANGSNNVFSQTYSLGSSTSWYYITWTLNNNNTWNLYSNGKSLPTPSGSSSSYPVQVYRQNMYIGKQFNTTNPQYFSGYLADFRMYNSVLSQTEITSIYTSNSKSPNAPNLIDKGFNQLYNQLYCNFMPTDGGFNNCTDCNFGDSMNIYAEVTATGTSDCQNKCSESENKMCTSYSFDKSTNNCVQYSNFPYEIFSGIENVNSGYSLNYSYPYSNLTEPQQKNVLNKCTSQYTNNMFTPKNEIDLSKCLKIENSSDSTTNLNYDPECVYKVYQKNGIKVNTNIKTGQPTYLSKNDYSESVSDPVLDKYKTKYESYITDKVQLSNINNVMSLSDQTYDKQYLNNVQDENNILGNQYIKSIKREMKPLINLSNQITEKVHMLQTLDEMNEGFDNNNSKNIGNNLKLIIFIIIVLIIFTVIYNLCK